MNCYFFKFKCLNMSEITIVAALVIEKCCGAIWDER